MTIPSSRGGYLNEEENARGRELKGNAIQANSCFTRGRAKERLARAAERHVRRHTQLYLAMTDLQSKHWIVAKGIAFGGIAVAAAVLLLFESTSVRTAVLLMLLVWAACRFYYFLFYVLERYVDPRLRYAGILALVRTIIAKR
jgi:hypothetical protein